MARKRDMEDCSASVEKRIKIGTPSPERTISRSDSDTQSFHTCEGFETEPADDTNDTGIMSRNKRSDEEVSTFQSDTDSFHSCKGYDTEPVNETIDTCDTSGTSVTSVPPIPQPYMVEYEIAKPVTDTIDTCDTSGTSVTSVPPIPQPYMVEYEIAEPDSDDQKFYYYSGDSNEPDDLPLVVLINAGSASSLDIAILGDTSEENSTSPTSNSDVDPELPRNDYLDFENCLLCKTNRKNISYPYCSDCFTWKKNFFPNRPKRKLKGFKRNNCQLTSQNKDNGNNLKEKIKQGSLNDGFFEDNRVEVAQPQLPNHMVDAPSQPSTSVPNAASTADSSALNNSEICKVCFTNPENGLFDHSDYVHKYGCYTCAKQIWYRTGVCPLCRRKVNKIKKLF